MSKGSRFAYEVVVVNTGSTRPGAPAIAAQMSPFHFLRTFKAVYGMTPSVYLSRKRTAAAVRLIRELTWSLMDIAEHVGFGSRTTLFRRLRAHTGIPAGALRSMRETIRRD